MNVALIGYGYAGKTFHAPLIRSVPGLRLATVVSSRPADVRADMPDVVVVPSPADVFADPAIALVVVATPNDSHFDLARRALEAAKHVVVDKPFTVTAAEAAAVNALAKQNGRVLSVFHNRRWDGDFLTVRRLVASGDLGDLVHFESHFDRYRPEVRKRWREGAGPGAGVWVDLGSHLVDQALQLFGPPEGIFADMGPQRPGAVAVDYFHVVLRYGRLRVVLCASNLVAETVRRFELHGTRASFVKHGLDTQEDWLQRGQMPGAPEWGADTQDGILTEWIDGARRARPVATVPGKYLEYYAALRDTIETGAPNPVTPEDGVAVMKLLELGVRSASERRELPCGE